MRKISAFAVLLAICCGAEAAEWIRVGGGNNVDAYVDIESIRRSGVKVKVWVKWIYSEQKIVSGTYPVKTYQSAKTLEIFDCADRSNATVQQIKYSDQDGGEVVKSDSIQESRVAFEEVVPDSLGETILKAVCKKPNAKI